jgi:hypothetical protein
MSDDYGTDSEVILYQTEDGQSRLQVHFSGETAWLTQNQMAELFQTTKQNVSLHIKNIFAEKELSEETVVKEFLTTARDGKNYQTRFYNLDVIISVGYRVKSHRGTQFRIWATQRLAEYIIKGFALDDERLKQGGRGNYFDELLHQLMTAQIRVHDPDLEGLFAQAVPEFGDGLSLKLPQAVAEMECVL